MLDEVKPNWTNMLSIIINFYHQPFYYRKRRSNTVAYNFEQIYGDQRQYQGVLYVGRVLCYGIVGRSELISNLLNSVELKAALWETPLSVSEIWERGVHTKNPLDTILLEDM